VTRKIRELSQHMEEQFDAQRDLDAELREKESHKLQEFRDKVGHYFLDSPVRQVESLLYDTSVRVYCDCAVWQNCVHKLLSFELGCMVN